MKKEFLLLIVLILSLNIVFASYGFQVQQRDHGLRKDCELGATTCFGFFFNACKKDSSNNVMWSTVKKCTSTEICDNDNGCIENVFNNPSQVILPEEKPDWAECTGIESKCSENLTTIFGCKNYKWEERQICSTAAICLNKFGCIKKEEIKKEVTPENYDYLISLQSSSEEASSNEQPDGQKKESNLVTGQAFAELPKPPQVSTKIVGLIESLVVLARDILLNVIA